MKNKVSLFPIIILGLVAVLGCGRLLRQATNDAPKVSDKRSDTFSLACKEWRSFDLDNMDINVDLPGVPSDKTPKPHQMPPGYKEIFRSVLIHSYDEIDFDSSYTQLVPTGKRTFKIKELADTQMAALKKQAPDPNLHPRRQV